MQIIVVRHGRTEYNEKELINGSRVDEPLSADGLAQIDSLQESLAAYAFDVVYASPLKRSIQTATPIATKRGIPLKIDKRITEVDLGSFSGKGWDSTIPDFGVNSSGVLSSCEYDFTPYGGESASQVRARLEDFIADLKKNPSQKPLIVAHGGIMRMINYICTGETYGRIPNMAVLTFEI